MSPQPEHEMETDAARLAARVEIALSNRLDIQRELDSQRASYPKRDRVFTVEPRVLVDNQASDRFTVMTSECGNQ